MTDTKRWLDELPIAAQERELLLVGKSARPADGAIDANWLALCAALSTTAAATVAVSSGVAKSSIASASSSAKVGSSLLATKAAGAGLLAVVAKSLAVGVVIGLAVMGAGSLAERSSRNDARPVLASKPSPPSTAFRPQPSSLRAPLALQADSSASPPPPLGPTASSSPTREHVAANSPAQNPAGASSVAPSARTARPEDKSASLSQQAHELAELKRLIDSGATSEALRRFDESFSAGATSALSEERDALHVQALARAQRRDDARSLARRFLARYPHSPYFETMRQLLGDQ